MSPYRHIFGPVPSRRFGRSLGVDLTPMKTCTLDCVFCQLGRTTRRTVHRRAYVPTEAVKAELTRWTSEKVAADCVTLSGSGEPTLHTGFGEVLACAADVTALPTVLLTNGTLLHRKAVRVSARRAHLVKASLSAWDERSFHRINRPHEGLSFKNHITGLRAFREMYAGELWLEVFLIEGLNAESGSVERIARLAESIAPDRVHLNTAVRPAAEPFVRAASRSRLESFAALFRPRAVVIDEYARPSGGAPRADEERVLDLLRRRPGTIFQIAAAFDLHANEASKIVGRLLRARRVSMETVSGAPFFRAAPAERTT